MKQHIHLAAMVLRDGHLWLVRETDGLPWELPGGPLDSDDADAAMDALLERFGIDVPAIEEDFVETIHLPVDDGHIVYNIYAPSDWSGEPVALEGLSSGWFPIDELHAIQMDDAVRDTMLVAFGLQPAPDRTAEFLAALNAQSDVPFSFVRTETTASANVEDRLRRDYPELAPAILTSLGSDAGIAALDARTRTLAALAALVSLGRNELVAEHATDALSAGATPSDVVAIVRLAGAYAGFPAAVAAWPHIARALASPGAVPAETRA